MAEKVQQRIQQKGSREVEGIAGQFDEAKEKILAAMHGCNGLKECRDKPGIWACMFLQACAASNMSSMPLDDQGSDMLGS